MEELNNCKLRTYRNTNSIISFEISEEFIFLISNTNFEDSGKFTHHSESIELAYLNGNIPINPNDSGSNNQTNDGPFYIHQYANVSKTSPLSAEIPFKPIFTCFYKKKFVLASKKELFYFKFKLFKIGNINPLSMSYLYDDHLVSIDCNEITIYKITENAVSSLKNTISKNNGICSAHFIFDQFLYLGFEDGSVYETSASISELTDKPIEMKLIECFKDPVLTIFVDDHFIFIHTLSFIFKIDKHDTENNICTKIRVMKILKYENFIISVEKNCLIFLDLNLKIKKNFRSVFDIVDCKIMNDSIFLGFKNGLLIEYSIDKVIRLIAD